MNSRRKTVATPSASDTNDEAPLFLTPRVPPTVTSTPRMSASKKKKTKTFVRPVCDTCKQCGKEYRCHRSYLNHVRTHRILDKASQYPKPEEVIQHLSDNCIKVLKDIEQKPAFSKKGREFKEFMTLLVNSENTFCDLEEWGQFKDKVHSSILRGFQSVKFMLPTALTTHLQANADSLLCDVEEREVISALFQVCYPCDEKMFQMFLADYVLHLIMDVVKFISSTLRDNIDPIPSAPNTQSTKYLETVHFIAGSKVRAMYKKSIQFPKHPTWKAIGRVITERLLENERVPGPPQHVKGWTIAQNRGKLFFVSGVLFNFFCGVAEFLEEQSSKVRVNFEDVIEKVCNSGVILMWDDAVEDSLSETDSYRLMCGLIRSFCQTFAVGKAKRIMNSIREKPTASVALRPKLAS